MAKNKKKKKNQNKGNQVFKNASAAELFRQGEGFLNIGKQRDAIACLKMAAKKGWPKDQVDGLLFKAYSLRAIQLREKGMLAEAEEVNNFAWALMPSYQSLTDEELLLLLKTVDIKKAIGAYSDFLTANKPSEKIEQYLAERLFIRPQWDLLDAVDERVVLTRDLPLVKDAINRMNAGDWESAYENLKPVPRSSPWSTVRIICHAMVCFYQEEDSGMQRALNMIADDSLLKPLACKLANDVKGVSCLWDGPVHLEYQIAALCDEICQNRSKKVGGYIKKIAETVSPRTTDSAVFHILELSWNMTGKGRMREYDYFDLIYKLLPQSLAKLLEAKLDCLMMTSTPFHNAALYLSMLELEFPEEKDRAMATGVVLLETIKNYQRSFSCGRSIEDNGNDLKRLLHLTSENLPELIAELLVVAVRHDPGNREAYELLADLMLYDRKSHAWIEEGFSIMQTHFSDDPYPCMELAKLYYRKNAYRKAEKILNEAMTRAPHDIRVMNMHVLSLLISADKNIARDNLQLAGQDIGKAEGLVSPDTRFLVTEKQILLRIAEKGQMSLFKNTTVVDHGDVSRTIDEFMERLTPFECLRSLGALFLDVNDNARNKTWDKKMIRVVDQAIRNRLKCIDTLTSSEINSLFMPLSLELPVIFRNNMAEIFEQRARGILAKIEDHCIIPVFDNLIRTRRYQPVLKEIKRRRKKADENFVGILDFYDVTVQHFKGDLQDDEFAFLDVVEDVQPSEIETLRVAARRLSTMIFDKPALKKSLEMFDFKYLDPDYGFSDWNGGYDDDYDDEFDDEFDADFDEFFVPQLTDMSQKMIVTMENLIIEAGLTGAPKKAVLKFKQSITSGPYALPLEMMTEFMDNATIELMSRELRIILFGKA
ncbi:MAG: hypothetical protein PF482_02330 [Desulfobacteraceae bacterium]|jgi:tetratricopeptide (TPR) repeat protein|nr:hypothetical protein [Desulfobacteraceae bacterium]